MIGDIDTCVAARAGASFKPSPTIRTRRPCGRLALNIAKLPELEKFAYDGELRNAWRR